MSAHPLQSIEVSTVRVEPPDGNFVGISIKLASADGHASGVTLTPRRAMKLVEEIVSHLQELQWAGEEEAP